MGKTDNTQTKIKGNGGRDTRSEQQQDGKISVSG
jgi:hypothetical protein